MVCSSFFEFRRAWCVKRFSYIVYLSLPNVRLALGYSERRKDLNSCLFALWRWLTCAHVSGEALCRLMHLLGELSQWSWPACALSIDPSLSNSLSCPGFVSKMTGDMQPHMKPSAKMSHYAGCDGSFQKQNIHSYIVPVSQNTFSWQWLALDKRKCLYLEITFFEQLLH